MGARHVASRRVIEGGVKHPGIKHVGRAMTLNLPQTLHDLNHYRHPSRFPFRAFPFEAPSTSISRFSRNVPHLPWHSTPSRCRSGGYTFARLPPHPFAHRSTFTTLFSRTVRRSSRDLLPIVLAPVPCSPPAYRDNVHFLLPRSGSRLHVSPLPHPFLSREPSQFRTCQF